MRSAKDKTNNLFVLVLLLLLLPVCLAYIQPGKTDDSSQFGTREAMLDLNGPFEQDNSTGWTSNDFGISEPHRPVYPYSIVPGGVLEPDELRNAVFQDSLVAEHFSDFDLSRSRVVKLVSAKTAYVSYRLKNKVFWTKKKVKLAKGETLISDGKNFARTRCANRISETAPAITSPLEPSAKVLDTPLPEGKQGAMLPPGAGHLFLPPGVAPGPAGGSGRPGFPGFGFFPVPPVGGGFLLPPGSTPGGPAGGPSGTPTAPPPGGGSGGDTPTPSPVPPGSGGPDNPGDGPGPGPSNPGPDSPGGPGNTPPTGGGTPGNPSGPNNPPDSPPVTGPQPGPSGPSVPPGPDLTPPPGGENPFLPPGTPDVPNVPPGPTVPTEPPIVLPPPGEGPTPELPPIDTDLPPPPGPPQPPTTSVPEPSSLVLLLSGLAGLAVFRRKHLK